MSGPIIVLIGQRLLLIASLPMMLFGWTGIAFAPNFLILQASRTFLGFTFGLVTGTVYIYAVEIAHCTLRGRISAMIDISRQLGMLYVFAVGCSSLYWHEIALVCGISTTILPFIGLFFLHDSPRWLVSKGRYEEAIESLIFYRGSEYDVMKEFEEIKNVQKRNKDNNSTGIIDQTKLLFVEGNGRIIAIISIAIFIFLFTGDNVVTNFAAIIFKGVMPDINEYLCTVILGVTNVIATIFYSMISDKFNRKPTCLVPIGIASVCLSSLGVYLYLSSVGTDVSKAMWLPLFLLITITFCGNISKPIVFLYTSELIPNSIRPLGAAIINSMYFGGYFFSVFSYPILVELFTSHGTFIFYSFCCIFMIFFCSNYIPETQGKSLEEIELILKNKGKNNTNEKKFLI